jgi:hypothetical protein
MRSLYFDQAVDVGTLYAQLDGAFTTASHPPFTLFINETQAKHAIFHTFLHESVHAVRVCLGHDALLQEWHRTPLYVKDRALDVHISTREEVIACALVHLLIHAKSTPSAALHCARTYLRHNPAYVLDEHMLCTDLDSSFVKEMTTQTVATLEQYWLTSCLNRQESPKPELHTVQSAVQGVDARE